MEKKNYIGIHHCEILVTDLHKALIFYTEKLGLEELHNPSVFSQSKWLRLGEQQLHLTHHPISDANEHRHFAIAVVNLGEARADLESKGVVIKKAIDSPEVDRFFIFDPFGNRIEFLQAKEKVSNVKT